MKAAQKERTVASVSLTLNQIDLARRALQLASEIYGKHAANTGYGRKAVKMRQVDEILRAAKQAAFPRTKSAKKQETQT